MAGATCVLEYPYSIGQTSASFRISYGTNTKSASVQVDGRLFGDGGTAYTTASGLAPNTTYTATVMEFGFDDIVRSGNSVTFTTLPSTNPFNPPVLYTYARGSDYITVQVSYSANMVSGTVYCSNGAVGYTNINDNALVTFTGLSYSTSYSFYCVGTSSSGQTATSTTLYATTKPQFITPSLSFYSATTSSATLQINYNSTVDHVQVYCDGNFYYHNNKSNPYVTITGLTTGTLYGAFVVGYSADESQSGQSATIQFETAPYSPSLTSVSGYPTTNEMRYTLTWGQGAYQTLIHLKKDGVVVQYWSATDRANTSVIFTSLTAGTYTVEAWSETRYYGVTSATLTTSFQIVAKPQPPTVSCSLVTGLTYQFSVSRDSIGKVSHITIYDSGGNAIVYDYTNTSSSFTVNLTVVKYREAHTWQVWVTNDTDISNLTTGSFTTGYAPKPSAYPSSYMEYYTGSTMPWYDVGHTKVIVCTANEWNTLRTKVNEVKRYNQGYGTGTDYSFTYSAVSSGQTVTASIYNDMVGAFNSIGLYPSAVSSGQKITGSHFKAFKDLINSKISTL